MSDEDKNDARRFHLEVEHDLALDYHEWVDLQAARTWRDAIARKVQGGMWRWHTLRCNNPDCPGVAVYRADIIERAAAEWDARRRPLSPPPGAE